MNSMGTSATGATEIAVVIVCFNMLEPLKLTLQSIFDMADPRLKVYVVDGASKDGTPAYLRTLRPDAATWISEPDRGIYDAMNKGWAMVPTSHFILYLGAGDRLLSLPSSATVEAALDKGFKILIGHCMHGDLSVHSRWYDMLYVANTIHHQAVLVHKSLHPKPPFDTSFKAYGDWEFNARLFRQGVTACNVEDFRSYADPDGLTRDVHFIEACRISYRHGKWHDLRRTFDRNARPSLRQQKRKLWKWLGLR